LTSAGQPDNNFGGSNNGTRVFDVDYANIGYSLVLQPQTTGDPKIVIGGYSASNGGTPYMAGGRVLPNGTGTPDKFQSNFSGTLGGSDGDQARQLQVQNDNKILAGGFHTVQTGPYFGIIRLCKDTDQGSCSDSGAPSGGGGGASQPGVPPVLAIAIAAGATQIGPVAILPTPLATVQATAPAPEPGIIAPWELVLADTARFTMLTHEANSSTVLEAQILDRTFEDVLISGALDKLLPVG
jgi:hypothetical protein